MKNIAYLCLVFGLAFVNVNAELRLPALLSDHAMLQADKPVAIWGWADPGAEVKVAFSKDGDSSPVSNFSATADASGKWAGQLSALSAGTAGKLQISTEKGEQKTVNDLLIGEVWLGSGQSNMEYVLHFGMTLQGKPDAKPQAPEVQAQVLQNMEIATKEAEAAVPPVRYFKVGAIGSDQPTDDVKGSWELINSSNILGVSAVAWNFGIALQQKLHVPLGLIVAAKGSTPVESWMSRETLAGTSVGTAVLQRDDAARAAAPPEIRAKSPAEIENMARENKPVRLYPNRYYNAMIHGLQPYTLRGILWFQADGNTDFPLEYGELFQAMINEWRTEWHDPLPFYFVELNNMDAPQKTPVELNNHSLLREQQQSALKLPLTGMAVSIDLGVKDPHFPNKKPLGERLAGLALRDCYHQPGKVNSPLYQSFSLEGNKVRLKFSDAEGLRVRGGGDLKGFAIRSSDGNWVGATGKVDGEDIIVWNDQITSPLAVRYAWATNPVISVENGEGLPLSPFRTDTESKE
jgi:sialate O-acetylesterase